MKKTITSLIPIFVLNLSLATELERSKNDHSKLNSPSVSTFLEADESQTLLGLEMSQDMSKRETGFIQIQCGYDSENGNYLPMQARVGITNQLEPNNTLSCTTEVYTSMMDQNLLLGAGLGLNHNPNDSLHIQASYVMDKNKQQPSTFSHRTSFSIIKSL